MRVDRHPREAERIEALRQYQILDTAPEAEFDELVALASRICETPVALVTLLDTDRQWFKAAVGTTVKERPYEESFCAHAILQPGLMEIPDLQRDDRFAENAVVRGAPELRFYAGVSLDTPDGLPLGTLCVLDTKPRELTDLQRETLRVLGRQVMTGFELRRQIEEAKAERQMVGETLELAGVATWAWDSGSDVVRSNPVLRRFFGITTVDDADIPLLTFLLSIHVEDRERVSLAIGKAVSERSPYETEYRVLDADGNERWVLARGHMIEGEETLAGVLVNVTARKLAETALDAERQQFRRLLDEVPAHVVTMRGEELRYEFANREFLSFLGRAPDFFGLKAEEAWPVPTDHISMLRTIVETGEPIQGSEVPVAFPSDPSRVGYFDFNFQPLRESDGTVSGVFVHSLDVTDKVLGRRQVAESEERFRIVAQATRDAVWDWDLRNDSIWWNEGISELFGYEAFEPTPGWWIEHVHPEDRERVKVGIQSAITSGQARWSDEYRYLKADGTSLVVEDRGFTIFEDGTPVRMLGAMTDVTERRMAQRRLETMVEDRTAELREAVQEAESFNYSISHDLRTPLRAISATSQIVLEEAGPELNEYHRELLERQSHNARRLGLLIDQLLVLSRLGRVEMVRSSLDLTRIARSVAAEIDQANPDWSCDVDVQEGMHAEGDPALVRLVLSNLIENAEKFSGGKGVIRVRQAGDVFSVIDEGAGFDMRYAKKLFLPFERLVKETEFPGTGIGLANVERIIRRHGGRVWGESSGKGATFSFTLAP